MTANQIRLLEHKERVRHNAAEENENLRSHKKQELLSTIGHIFGKPGVINTEVTALKALTNGGGK